MINLVRMMLIALVREGLNVPLTVTRLHSQSGLGGYG